MSQAIQITAIEQAGIETEVSRWWKYLKNVTEWQQGFTSGSFCGAMVVASHNGNHELVNELEFLLLLSKGIKR